MKIARFLIGKITRFLFLWDTSWIDGKHGWFRHNSKPSNLSFNLLEKD